MSRGQARSDCRAAWPLGLFLLLAAPPSTELTIVPQPGQFFDATWIGPAADVGAGRFLGTLAVNGSPVGIRVSGRADRLEQGLRISIRIRYADVPEDWARRWLPGELAYDLRGQVEGSGSVAWSGRSRWEQVRRPDNEPTLAPFVALASLQLTVLTARSADGRAVLTVTNPFSFPVTVASIGYELEVRGQEIGSATAKGRTLRARKKTFVELPFRVDARRLISAAGEGWAVGGSLDSAVEARLTLRLPGEDVSVRAQVHGAMGTDGAGGVSALPAATSLVPR